MVVRGFGQGGDSAMEGDMSAIGGVGVEQEDGSRCGVLGCG